MRRLSHAANGAALALFLGGGFCVGGCRAPAVASPRSVSAPVKAGEVSATARRAALGPGALQARAQQLAHACIMVDGHIDLPWRLEKGLDPDGRVTEDISTWTRAGEFDLPRARAGGLDAPFMSIYVPSELEMNGAKVVADRLIDMVEAVLTEHPDAFAFARSPADVRANFAAGKISLPMGMENGAPLEGELANVQHFFDRGIRYITLAHAEDNHLSDASYDDRHSNRGLSDFGRQVVTEMNRLGIMVDVSHLSDEAFWHVLEVSKAPVIASHSSARHFTPGWERNISDEMIVALAKNGGVVQVNFGSIFIDDGIRKRAEARRGELQAALAAANVSADSPRGKQIVAQFRAEHPPEYATVAQVADHIDHIVGLVGVDHVGFGSDFDGLGDMLPLGLKDVADFPNLIAELLARGYDDEAIHKICGENVLRVWTQVERVAEQMP